jgi:Cu-processing system ATP-binding protein
VLAAGSLDKLRGLAGLPIQVDISVTSRFSNESLARLAQVALSAGGLNGHRSITCSPQNKIELLRRVAAMPDVTDISIAEPTLDQIYAHFLNGTGARS